MTAMIVMLIVLLAVNLRVAVGVRRLNREYAELVERTNEALVRAKATLARATAARDQVSALLRDLGNLP